MGLKNFSMILLLVLLAGAFASAITDLSKINGDLQVKLEKAQYNAGEELTAEITVYSMEAFPIAEANLIVELVKGKEQYYPSTLSNEDNVFFEQRISQINLRPGESKKIGFSFKLPEGLSAGEYRLDAFFRTERSSIVGLAHIFNGPKSINFSVKNNSQNNAFPELKILRAETFFHDAVDIQTTEGLEPEGIGPIGPPTKPGAEIVGKVFVENTSGQSLKSIEVSAKLCAWDDSLCDSFLSESKAVIGSINSKETKTAELKLTAPAKPDAYAIRIEVKKEEEDGKLVSLYRNRAVVIGEGARIRKLYSNAVELEKGKPASFNALVSPSADHWLMPEFKDFSLKFSVENLESGEKVFEKTVQIALIDYSINFLEKSFEFTPSESLAKYKICAIIEKSGKEFDNYCTVYDSSKFSKLLDYSLETTANRTQGNSLLELKFCTSPENQEINANYQLLSENSQELVASENLSGNNCVQKILTVESSKKFVLAVTDYVSKTQKIIPIGLPESNQAINGGEGTIVEKPISASTIVLIIELALLAIGIIAVFVGVKLLQKKKRRGKK